MTEQDWLTSTNPRGMFVFLGDEAGNRKLRLFACACCRQVWNPFVSPFTIRIVMAAEAFADGAVSRAAFRQLRDAATEAAVTAERTPGASGYLVHVARAAASACSEDIHRGAHQVCVAALRAAADYPATGHPPEPTTSAEYLAEQASQADLLRDVFGNPFRSAELELEWLTSDVLALARGIYADRAFDRMPILADALQDAGCDDDDILEHCRGACDHVRGCWVVDRLLGKS